MAKANPKTAVAPRSAGENDEPPGGAPARKGGRPRQASGKRGRASADSQAAAPDRDARQIVWLSIAELRPDPRNPRKHGRAQIQAIAKSIDAFGFNAPVLVDRRSQIVAGHGRVEAAKLLGLTTVPVIRLEHLTERQAQAYMLADNKLTDRSSWDDEALSLHLKELSQLALDFEIEATGFELPEIDFRIQSLDALGDSDAADDFEISDEPAVSQPGDLWLCGAHRLICGDALDPATYARLMDGARAAAIFTDPPYNVKIDGNVCGSGAIKHREFAMASGEMNRDQFAAFLQTTMRAVRDQARPGALAYVCMDWRHLEELLAAGRAARLETVNLCVWVKDKGGMGSFYRSRHELVLVFKNGATPNTNNVQLGRFGRNRTNVWHYPGVNGFGRKKELALHPTVKPIAMVVDALLDSTDRGDAVLDPFLGSGTTLLAAERTGRCCRGVELDARYVDTAIRRWERLSGAVARHQSGATFAELRQQRGAAA